ncbi:ATP-binding cassette domain-containing protein [Butyrivibrio sp. AE3004]|uniref:ATP-binding cassette domain-containing protein n=1 Tax=Butyrivibrio sp. AE3004 TaxID=1506994 RepID=UPI000493E84C|nr:ABC transporter ATP-binding protein [Butyrivibrio sp. AE3004]
MENRLLEIDNLSALYEDRIILQDINLDVRKGEVLCVVGESGSGKSTLIRAICKDDRVKLAKGSISFNGECISNGSLSGKKKGNNLLGKKIGLIQQNPEGAFNPLRTFDVQFKETLKSHGMKFDKDKLEHIFTTLGLKDTEKILKSHPYEMSGGMNQRIAIAASLILDPELLLCDEITSALDVSTAIAVTEELLRLKKELDVTIVFVTHNLGIAANIGDRIAIMNNGQIVEDGKAGEVLRNPRHEYTKGLLRNVPKLKVV